MALSYFTTKTWVFKTHKTLSLATLVPPCDSEHFKLEGLDSTDNAMCLKNIIMGMRLYLLKEHTDILPHAIRHYNR
jgi:hypothetical protein